MSAQEFRPGDRVRFNDGSDLSGEWTILEVLGHAEDAPLMYFSVRRVASHLPNAVEATRFAEFDDLVRVGEVPVYPEPGQIALLVSQQERDMIVEALRFHKFTSLAKNIEAQHG